MSSVQSTASRPRQNRTSTILLAVGAAVLAAGVVVLVLKLTSGSNSSTHQQANPAPSHAGKQFVPPKPPTAPHIKYSQLPEDLRATVKKFVLTAVVRKNTGESWDITTPGLRQGMGKKAWAKGDIPVQYFPVYKFGDSHFRVTAKTPNEIALRIGLQATPKSGLHATAFDLDVHKFGKPPHVHWKVNYWMPYYSPAMPMQGSGGAGGA
jgi:hypothetical protein